MPGNAIDPILLTDVCRNLRVIHALKNINRTTTCCQIKNMKQEILIRILLRYNHHYLACEICKHLHFPSKLISHVYIHWACCKVMSDEDDEILSEVIY